MGSPPVSPPLAHCLPGWVLQEGTEARTCLSPELIPLQEAQPPCLREDGDAESIRLRARLTPRLCGSRKPWGPF